MFYCDIAAVLVPMGLNILSRRSTRCRLNRQAETLTALSTQIFFSKSESPLRWPLKNQILIRLLLLLLVTIIAMTVAFIRSSIAANKQRYQQRIADISGILANARFPLNATVLDQMRQLSGAEFIVVDSKGSRVASSTAAPDFPAGETIPASPNGIKTLNETIMINGKAYFHTMVPVSSRDNSPTGSISVSNRSGAIHVLVSRDDYNQLWWRSVRPPIVIAAIIIPLAILLSLAMSGNVTRPLARLQEQVSMIATGDFQHLPDTDRNDEIGDLSKSVNQMADRLVNHDQQVRQNERLETLVLMSSGVAHNLRNSVTGCKMAIDLLAEKQSGDEPEEEIQVARRQLGKMSHYIDRFLSLAKSSSVSSNTTSFPIDLAEVLRSVSFLTKPHTKHLNVLFEAKCNKEVVNFLMERGDAEQVMTNLINNAIDAASEAALRDPILTASVCAELIVDEKQRIDFVVTDTGNGPPSDISDSLHLPFVTGKQAGTGLGLSLVHDIANRIDGKLDWYRDSTRTRFVFTFSFGNEQQC